MTLWAVLTLIMGIPYSCSDQPVEECPSQHKATQPLYQPPGPELHATLEVSFYAAFSILYRRGAYP